MSDKNITMDDIARELGISKTTVSRAMSGKGRIGRATVERVQAYIEEHNYHPSAIAQSLASSKSYNIAFVVTQDVGESDIPFFQRCMWSAAECSKEYGYNIIVCTISDNDLSSLEKLVSDRKIDGAIVGRTVDDDKTLQFLRSKKVPFITIGSITDEDTYQVDNNHFDGCRELTEQLLGSGKGKLALFGGNSSYNVNRTRLAGYLKAHKNQRYDADQRMIFRNLKSESMIEDAVKTALMNKVSCFVCMDDVICSKVVNYLDKADIKIPRDVEVVSFYDSILLANHVPAITALGVNVSELGYTACNSLVSIMEGREVTKKQQLDIEYIKRDSTR